MGKVPRVKGRQPAADASRYHANGHVESCYVALIMIVMVGGCSKRPIQGEAVVEMAGRSRQEEWQRKTLQYVESVNAFVERGLRDGWKNAGDEPKDPGREHLAQDVISAIREANSSGQLASLRELWPPAHEPLIALLEENGQSIPTVCVLPDKSIIARLGAPYEPGKTIHIVGDSVQGIDDVPCFGRSSNRRYFAIAKSDGIRVLDGWGGPQVGHFPWPTGLEGLPAGFDVQPIRVPPTPTRLIPFPDGSRVLLVSSEGIFVLSSSQAVRLLPTTDQLREHFGWLRKEHPGDDLSLGLSMEHGAVSHDGKFIAVGSQDSTHLLFDENLTIIGDIGNRSEYPHYALFSSDDSMVAFNSCHFYNGLTLGVPLNLLPGLKTEPYEPDERITVLQDGARVYAGTCLKNEFIIGDASGYVRAFNTDGEPRWQLFIGSSVGDIDLSDDGKLLVVSTYAGFISIIQMDAGKQAPHQIGNSKHMETRRWVFWKNEERPLIW
jgi:hypothetical protein